MSMSVAVIGGSGFIGTSIAETLSREGYSVAVFDLVPPDPELDVIYEYYDMTDNDQNSDVFHPWHAVIIASGALAKMCTEKPWEAWRLNVQATLSLINKLVAVPSPPRIVFLSSGMVYDGDLSTPPFTESAATASYGLYTASKLVAEHCLLSATYVAPIHTLILRPFTVYGTQGISADRGHLFGRWLELGRRGKKLKVYGDGSQVIDPVSVHVVAEACSAYLKTSSPKPRMIVNVTSGGCISLLRLAEIFIASDLAPGLVLESEQPADTRRGWGEPSALEGLLDRKVDRNPQSAVTAFLLSLK